MAEVILFQGDPRRELEQRGGTGPEIIIFPGTNIRALRRQRGLPQYGVIAAGPDGRELGARRDDAPAG